MAALLKDDAETLQLWRKAVTPERGTNQHTMTEDHSNRMTRQGTTTAYTLDRLKREAPALFKQVCDGEPSVDVA